MYNREKKCWESAPYGEAQLLWCRGQANRANPQAQFILADHALEEISGGGQTAEAVFFMESAAEAGHPRAAFAMGQLFQYGWGVHRSQKHAMQWYERAAELGDGEAAALVAELRRARKRRIVLTVCGAAAVLAAALCIPLILSLLAGPQGVLVHEDTDLITAATQEEFQEALNGLITEYDDELVVSGLQSTNRILLKFEGEGIDLRQFPAATVVADSENYVIIQFATEEEAARCLEALRDMDSVLFAELDEYNGLMLSRGGIHTSSGVPYVSPHSGEVYYSWGVEYLGLDRLAAWVDTQSTTPVTVAVLDTGFEPCDENAHCYLKGADMNDPSRSAWTDDDGHGTHVAGTIIDCTWGLDVTILPVRVFLPGYGSGAPDSYIVEGIRYAIQYGADVINMSLGGRCARSEPGDSCGGAIDYYVGEALAQNIVVVLAAGNGDEYGNPEDTNIVCPAHIDECIVVAACDVRGDLASFSNFGDSVDLCAPGVDVVSYYPGDTFESLNGTSMAAPHISALAAMLKLYLPDRTPAQIEKYITDYCVQMGSELYYGEGVPWAGYLAGE